MDRPPAQHPVRHSQISVTMSEYTQIASPETRKALDRLNSDLEGPTAGRRLSGNLESLLYLIRAEME